MEFIVQEIEDKLHKRSESGVSVCSVGWSLPKCTTVFC